MIPEAAVYLHRYRRVAERMLEVLAGADEAVLNRQPFANGNSLYVLAAHTFANLERNVTHHFAGRPYVWHRDEEFAARGANLRPLRDEWARIAEALDEVLAAATAADMDRLLEHPNMGQVTGREVLMRGLVHAHEHLGHAEMTRDLWAAQA